MLTTVLPALVASALLVAFAFWIYLRRELPIPGRRLLAGVRAAVLVLLVLLLVDPELPARAGPGAGPWVILDASRSMTAEGPDGAPWTEAVTRARRLQAEGATLLLLGDPPVGAPAGVLDTLAPAGDGTRIAPALQRAAEAGANRVTLLTDLRVEDPLAAEGEAARLGLPVDVVDLGGTVRSAGIARLDVPAAGRGGAEVEVSVEAFGTEGAAGDSAALILYRDGEPVGNWPLRVPPPGAVERRTYRAPLPERPGPVHWRAEVTLAGDAFPDDDARTRVTEVDPAAGLVALVALAPDWEPRFLLPVLEAVTGLPTRGWLRVGPDAFLPMEGGEAVSGETLRPLLEDARVVVLQGRGGDTPAWVEEVAAEARRLVSLASDQAGAAAAGLPTSPARPGEWYVTDPPASPLGSALSGLRPAGLPPLTRVLAVGGGAGPQAALAAQPPGGGPPIPVVVLLDDAERRHVVLLATGFWRWAFRPGEPREAYRRLWSGVAGWLLELEAGRTLAGVAPEAWVVRAARPVAWRAPRAAGGVVELTLARADSDSAMRVDTLAVSSAGDARQAPLEPGRWSWQARVLAPDSVAARDRLWRGTLEAEAWTGELLPPRTRLALEGEGSGAARSATTGIPLRTRPWPYLLLLALLSLEWFGRRRRGLR